MSVEEQKETIRTELLNRCNKCPERNANPMFVRRCYHDTYNCELNYLIDRLATSEEKVRQLSQLIKSDKE